ncbi:hypothetical protein FRC17_001764 [Serendipita sp. 399]|nr:hypothetical protein FRC17_001764 [Serendipita sp. 399]
MARWVFNSPNGYRTHPYSTDPAVNPLKYGDVANMTQPHDIGEVWANMLHNVYAGLVAQSGWASDSFTNPDSSSGNVVFLRNFMDGLLLQPCNPTFVQARDAWIQGTSLLVSILFSADRFRLSLRHLADINRYGGAHQCTIWNAFASRGLGVAAANFVNDFNLPEICGGTPSSQPAAEEPTGSIPDPTELPTGTLAEIPTPTPGL